MKTSLPYLAFRAFACIALLAVIAFPVGCQQGGGTDVGNPEMRIRGSIRHLDGRPAADIPLHLRSQNHLQAPDTNTPFVPAVGILQDGRTDTQGFFVFDSVPKGEYRIEAMDTNGRGAIIGVSALGDSPSLELKPAVLDYTGSIHGQIKYLGDPSKGYPKISISVYGMDRSTLATNSGTYVLSDLPPGKYKLRISMASNPANHVDIPETGLAAGQKVTVGPVELSP